MEHLIKIRNERSSAILSECGFPDITVRQITYLKAIEAGRDMTFSQLAEITKNSKPTITETINKFVTMGCVYREPSPHDRRVMYIRLTDRGLRIARVEENALEELIDRMRDSLDEEDMEVLIQILRKVR